MKEKLVLLFLFFSVVVFGQKKKYTLTWEAPQTISGGSYTIEIPSFNKANFIYDFDDGIQFVDQWEISSTVNEVSITIDNVTYTPISKIDLKDLDVSKIPNELKFSLKNSKTRDKLYALFQLSPISSF